MINFGELSDLRKEINFMEKIDNLCPYCMTKSLKDGECTHCYHEGEPVVNEAYQLPVMYALDDRYVIGRVLGEGNFGITYLAYDSKHNVRTAIKEYYPVGFAARKGTEVSPYSGDKTTYYNRGVEKFKSEAESLAKFADKPGIVKIRETLEANGTVYIVMEFVEGKTLEERLSLDNTMSEKDLLAIMKPLIASLAEMHEQGIIHRDIAPDNIIIEPSETAKLIDFGSAVVADGSGGSTMSIIKHGYAPEEQFDMNRERQGTWTDVYSLCAVMYRVLSGKIPPDSLDRFRNNNIEPLPDEISESTKKAISFGLELLSENRTKNAGELYGELYEGKKSPLDHKKGPKPNPKDTGGGKNEGVIATPILKPGEEIIKEPKPEKEPRPEKEAKPMNTPAVVLGIIAALELVVIIVLLLPV
jgi:serine/threonine protein kinase